MLMNSDNQARTNNAVESCHASLRRRTKVPHPNLFAFLGHLQQTTIDSQSDVSRITSGLPVRRAKKRVNLTNDKRIKMCMQRFDNAKYTRLQLKSFEQFESSEQLVQFQQTVEISTDSLKSDDFRLRYNDKTIFKMAAVRHLEFSKCGILRAVSHAVGSDKMTSDSRSDADDVDDTEEWG